MKKTPMPIQVFDDTSQPKADSLFEGIDPSGTRTRWCQNSEHWWTTLFTLLLLYLAKQNRSANIPLRRLREYDDKRTIFEPAGRLDYQGITFSNLAVEARMKHVAKHLFNISEWSSSLASVEPDITICWPEGRGRKGRAAAVVESKTVRAKAGRLESNLLVKKCLEDHQWDVDLIVLISLGNSQDDIWKVIEANNTEFLVVLWEDVLRVLDEIEMFKSFFDVRLAPYYEQVIPLTP